MWLLLNAPVRFGLAPLTSTPTKCSHVPQHSPRVLLLSSSSSGPGRISQGVLLQHFSSTQMLSIYHLCVSCSSPASHTVHTSLSRTS